MNNQDSIKLRRQLELINEVVSKDTYNLGAEFFETIVEKLNQVLGADYTFVGRLSETGDQVETLALSGKNGLLENITYSLNATPCANVIGQKACTFRKGIRQLFPKDQLLIDLGIEAYVGIPLFDSNKSATGILVSLYKNEIEDSFAIESILMIFASRVSAELEHSKLQAELENHKWQLELKVAEEQSKREELLKAIYERDSYWDALNNSSLVSVTDLQGSIIYANDRFVEVSKFNRDELIGSNHNILNSDYHPKSFWIDMWKSVTKGNIWRADVRNKAKDGSYYWVDTNIAPIRNAAGKVIQFLSVRKLITERKELEESREALLNDFEEFAFIASHKIRGPLARIIGLLDLIDQDEVTTMEREDLLKALSTASNEMDEVIHEMVASLSRNALMELIKRRRELQAPT